MATWEIGNIDNSPIGQTTPAAGAFTTLKASSDPVDAHGVGDRGYNDIRYAGAGSHAASHTDGTDDIQNATAAQKGVATATQITKLDGIDTGADVTNATNIAAAGGLIDSNNLSDVGTATTAFTNIKQLATETATGVIEKATTAECVTGTDTDRSVTPAGLTARLAAPGAIGGTTPAAGDFTALDSSGIQTDSNSGAGNTRLLVYDVDNGIFERVTVGVADSGGAGFKVLRIPN